MFKERFLLLFCLQHIHFLATKTPAVKKSAFIFRKAYQCSKTKKQMKEDFTQYSQVSNKIQDLIGIFGVGWKIP